MSYVNCTQDLKLKLFCSKPQIITYSDSDFAANRDDRTSLGGMIVLLGDSPIEWKTFKERSVSLSTMKAEFIAMTHAAKELIWIDRILTECFERNLIFGRKVKSTLYVDNQAAIAFVKSPIENSRSKHIDVKLLFIRDLIYKETFVLEYIRSKSNLSDSFTKPPTKQDLSNFVNTLFVKE